MRRVGVFAAALAALVPVLPAGAGKLQVARTTPGVVELMGLRGHPYALVQLPLGRRLPGAKLVSRRLGVWRLPSARAQAVVLGLHPLAIEADREVMPQRAATEPFAGLEWWRAAIGADRVSPPGPGKGVTVIDTGLDVSHPEFAGRPNTTLLNAQSTTGAEDELHGTALFLDWYKAGFLFPFLRNHSMRTFKRQEPWVFPKEAFAIVRRYVRACKGEAVDAPVTH